MTPGNYPVTYEYTNSVTGCTSSCTFNIIVTYPAITDIIDDNIAANISVCPGTSENEAIDELEDEITITDSEGTIHNVTLSWAITGYNPETPGDYNAIALLPYHSM